jgi:ABC-2 type transport system permease protein
MDYIKHKFAVLKAVAFVTYKEWSAYRTHSMVSIFVGPVYFIVQYFIWKAVYSGRANINGIELSGMLTYFGATALIGYLTMDFADWNLQMLVRTGKFLTFALRPIHHRFFALSQKVVHRILGFLFEFLPCLAIFTFLFNINMMPKSLFWTIISILLAFLMNFYINYIIGTTAFWFVQSTGIRRVFNLLQSIFSGTLIPLVFFPLSLQKLLFFLPFQYVSYVPAMVFTGKYSLANISMPISHIVLIQAVAVIVTGILSEGVYRVSMKRFTGVGA